jgi:hypothetical protein
VKRSDLNIKNVIGVVTVIASVVILIAVIRREGVARVTVQPGQTAELTIETRMQRLLEHKSYAKQRGLPVGCWIRLPDDVPESAGSHSALDPITISVVDTGHSLHTMWAKLEITAVDTTSPGVYQRIADFGIDGETGWPAVTMAITVAP